MATKKTTATKKTSTPKAKPALKVHKPASGKRPKKAARPKRTSALDAAARVLSESKQPMTTQELIDAMAVKGYWSSPHGLTPAATLYSALSREITKKKSESRFEKTERGKFTLAGKG